MKSNQRERESVRKSVRKRKSEREREGEGGGQSERESEKERDLFDLNRSCVNFDYAVSFVQRFRVIRCNTMVNFCTRM